MANGIVAIYEKLFLDMRFIDDTLFLLRDDSQNADEAKNAKTKYLEDKKSELCQLYFWRYGYNMTIIMDKLQTIENELNDFTISSVTA